jgi:hypothetical protein
MHPWLDLPKIEDVSMWHLREHLLQVWQIFLHVGTQKKLINEDTTTPQDSQKGGPKNK